MDLLLFKLRFQAVNRQGWLDQKRRVSKGMEIRVAGRRCDRGGTAGAPVGAMGLSGAGAPAGIRTLAMPFLNCLHGQRAGRTPPPSREGKEATEEWVELGHIS